MSDREMDSNDTLQHLVDSLNLDGSYNRPASWVTASSQFALEEEGAGGASLSRSASHAARSSQSSFQRSSPTSSLFAGGTSPPARSHHHTLSSARSTPALTSSPVGGRGGSIRRLSAMSSTDNASATPTRRARPRYSGDSLQRIVTPARPVPAAQKDGDDPSTPVDSSRLSSDGRYSTPTALTRLLAAEMTASPEASRHPSYNNEGMLAAANGQLSDASTLPEHLYTRGFLGGRHSDITIIAFGQRYPLHRLILDRAPFFMNGLSEPWVESSQRDVPLHPEELDTNITKTSFELALKKLYGVDISAEEDAEAVGLFATGCWLEMQDLVDAAVESILRQMAPDNLASLIKLVTSNYYGKAGERILASARAMLCRDGSEMPSKYWHSIPADVVRDVVGGDGFYVEDEWERWRLARRLLDKRLKHKAVEVGILQRYAKHRPQAPAADLWLQAVRTEPSYQQEFLQGTLDLPESVRKWCTLYTHPEVEPIVTLLYEGVYYAHLDFEALRLIRESRDIFGLPVVPDKLIMEAQWQQLELRSRVLGARDTDLELGLSLPLEHGGSEDNSSPIQNIELVLPSHLKRVRSIKGKGKAAQDADDTQIVAAPSPLSAVPLTLGPRDVDDKRKRFHIPKEDCNIVMGGNSDPVITASSTVQRSAPGESIDTTQDVTVLADSEDVGSSVAARPDSYSTFPPFRFSAEFPNPRQLKEKKRVYSRTVFYAGSFWNVYIQKVRSARNPQLGVYLHRAKEREVAEGVISGVGTAGQPSYLMSGGHVIGSYGGRTDSIDEQIGRLEREMLLRGERREHHRAVRAALHRSMKGQPIDPTASRAHGTDDTSGSGDETQPSAAAASSSARLASYGRQRSRRKIPSEDAIRASLQQSWNFPAEGGDEASGPSSSGTDDDDSPDEDDMFNAYTTIPPGSLSQPSGPSATSAGGSASTRTSPTTRRPRKLIVRSSTGQTATPGPAAIARDQRERETQAAAASATGATPGRPGINRTPTLPPYVDARPTIHTWFKIYSPSRGGRLLSVYESAPDQFNFSQSWGWRSGSLMLDEGFGVVGGGEGGAGAVGGRGSLGGAAEVEIATGDVGEKETDGGMWERGGSMGAGGARKKRWRPKGEGKLRFMIVIGNL